MFFMWTIWLVLDCSTFARSLRILASREIGAQVHIEHVFVAGRAFCYGYRGVERYASSSDVQVTTHCAY